MACLGLADSPNAPSSYLSSYLFFRSIRQGRFPQCGAVPFAACCDCPRSVLRLSVQRAACVQVVCRNLRLQPLYGHTQPANGRTKVAYVHPKTANGDFTQHREDSYQGAGMNDEGCWEICSLLLHPLHDALQAGLKCFAFRSQHRSDDTCSRFFLAVYGLCLCFTRDWLMPGCRMQSVRDGLDGCLRE